MELKKQLGKINEVFFGIIDGRIGLHLDFSFGSSGVSWSEAHWDPESIKVTSGTKWTEEERSELNDKLMRKISLLLSEAKVKKIEDLKNKPVELHFDGSLLKTWRILTEVL